MLSLIAQLYPRAVPRYNFHGFVWTEKREAKKRKISSLGQGEKVLGFSGQTSYYIILLFRYCNYIVILCILPFFQQLSSTTHYEITIRGKALFFLLAISRPLLIYGCLVDFFLSWNFMKIKDVNIQRNISEVKEIPEERHVHTTHLVKGKPISKESKYCNNKEFKHIWQPGRPYSL